MSNRNKADHRISKNKTFVHRLTRENVMQFKDASAEAKLQWLEEANAFVRQFVTARRLERWKAFLRKDVKRRKA